MSSVLTQKPIVLAFCFLWLTVGHVSAQEGPIVPGVPEDIMRLLEECFSVWVLDGESRWEQQVRHKRSFYDVSVPLRESKSLESAASLFGINKALVAIGLDQLKKQDMKWETVPLAQRHRVLDFLLALEQLPEHAWYSAYYVGDVTSEDEEKLLRKYLKGVMLSHEGHLPKDEWDQGVNCVLHRGSFKFFSLVGRAFVAETRDNGVTVTQFKPEYGAERTIDAVSPAVEGIATVAVVPDSGVSFLLVRCRPVFTTQPPSVLVHVKGGKRGSIPVPANGVLSEVAVSNDGKMIALGTRRGVVLRKVGDDPWVAENVFSSEDVVKSLHVQERVINAVGENGRVERFDGGWKTLRGSGKEQVVDSTLLPTGEVLLLFANGLLERVSSKGKDIIDYRSVIPAEERQGFVPGRVFIWAGHPCVSGHSGQGAAEVIDTVTGQWWAWDWPMIDDPTDDDLLSLLASRMPPRPVILGAWSDSQVFCWIGLWYVSLDKNGKVAFLGGLLETMKAQPGVRLTYEFTADPKEILPKVNFRKGVSR